MRLFCFVAITTIMCIAAGWLLDVAERKARGTTARTLYINDSLKSDVLVFGSSRALHQYDPEIIEAVLHHTVYNCGEDKMGIIFNYGRYRLISRRYMPKMIVYDVEPDYDLLYDDNTSYLSGLRRYQDLTDIRQLFIDVDPTERFKTMLPPYRLNNRTMQTVKDCIAPSETYKLGYLPYTDIMKVFIPERLPQNHYDTLKLKYLRRLVSDCNRNTKIVFTASPQLSYRSDSVYTPLRKFCAEHRIAFLNHFCDTTFTNHPRLFYNANHLQKKGAEKYSRMIAAEIKRSLKQ